MTASSTFVRCLLAVATGLTAASAAQADGDRVLLRNVPPAYTQECAACHTGYAPGMLPARSWQRIMNGLDQHHGTDASLDAATVKQLSTWLQTNAGTTKRVAEPPPEDRITRAAWFVREHDEVAPSVWKLASVKSAAHCGACHTGADQGDYSERTLQAPAGLDARQRRAWND